MSTGRIVEYSKGVLGEVVDICWSEWNASPAETTDRARNTARRARHPLAGVVSIVEANVASIWNEFHHRLGPRTFVSLANVIVHAGKPLRETTFSQLGGPLPQGGWIEVSDLPQFAPDARYILFFGANASVYTAIWAGLAFRIARRNDRDLALGPEGTALLKFGVSGMQFGRRILITDSRYEPDVSSSFDPLDGEGGADLDIVSAMTAQELVAAARVAAEAMGAPFDQVAVLEPDADAHWEAGSP